jgi:hypothetical protein
MKRKGPAPMSLDQVEAQLRSGPPPANPNMYRPGMDPSFRPPMQQQMFNRPMMSGPGLLQQPQMPIYPSQMHRPIHPQAIGRMQRQTDHQILGHMQPMQRPMQHVGATQIQRPMQQLNMGQRPVQPPGPGQIQRPPMPRTIVVDGITVTPIDLTNQEKDNVFSQVFPCTNTSCN